MCGIAGFVTIAPASGSEATLARMTDAIRHRGPDDSGYYHDQWAHLGHRRLSIIDAAGGHQPMSNAARTHWITYNGEVFNHADLRPALEAAGHGYISRSDTETVLHAYEQHGQASLQYFRGMFAYAIWDNQRPRLFCARDRLGIKPFYYFWDGRVFAFASEIKALLEHPAISPELEAELVPDMLAFGYSSDDRTLYHNIRKLMPGHFLVLDLAEPAPAPKIESFWDVPAPVTENHADQYWIAETRRRLEETVRTRLMSDVPLGMFLSGGLDSSAIAALIKRSTSGPVKTFAVGYQEQQFSELSYAAQVARAIGTEHHETVVSMDDFFSTLPQLLWHEDEPIAWPSSVSLYFASKLAASHEVKVVLTGEGSDEMFGGYERYRWNLLNQSGAAAYRFVPAPLRRWIRSQVATSPLLSPSLRRKLGHSFLGRAASFESLFLDNFYCAFSAPEQTTLLNTAPRGVYQAYLQHWNSRGGASPLARMLYADQKTYLVELLMKQDQMSMACSIESRVPFLDHTFVEFSTRIPDRLKIRGRTQKYVLKKAVEDLLPHDIIYRKKMGFPTPLRDWLLDARAEPLYAAILSPDGLLASLLDMREVGALIDRHRSGFEDATDRIWRLLNLQLWGDLFLTGRKNAASQEPASLPV
ncbi:MAG TPA: asparagine synthase (glutamine-hydrolyzing) [Bryobacteraceae bacterium]|jgi:asparagine synthase (glutamine-hydrolysing)|nr:asparagine synthase (glutamine-hydrolyzing) [Bryobacteraceae bacterium]